MLSAPKRILIVRNDKLGDTLLALPVLRALRQALPKAHIAWWASNYAAPLLEKDSQLDEVLVEPSVERLRQGSYDTALLLFARASSALKLWRAGIARRLGANGRPYSLLLNQRLNLRRSQGQRHESEFNLDFVRALGLEVGEVDHRWFAPLEDQKAAKAWLKKAKLPTSRKGLLVLHPGMGGSAFNWPKEHYVALAKAMVKLKGKKLLVTAGSGLEREAARAIAKQAAGAKLLEADLSLRVFGALLGEAEAVVAPSTGPLHLASSQGVATLSFYPAAQAMSALRWAPRGGPRVVLSPPGLGFKAGVSGMEMISVQAALDGLTTLLAKGN